jgi:hypothetical protein
MQLPKSIGQSVTVVYIKDYNINENTLLILYQGAKITGR